MGSFYVNATVESSAEQAGEFLKAKNLNAFVMPTAAKQCVIYEAICDMQDIEHLHNLLVELTAKLDCVALGVLNHDSDMLLLTLFKSGEYLADYTCGWGFDEMYEGCEVDEEGELIEPEPKSAEEIAAKEQQKKQAAHTMSQMLASAFNCPDKQEAILAALHKEFVFASEVQEALADIIGLPDCSIGLGYNYISELMNDGHSEDELDMSKLIKVGN
ncbi:hypothetical protein [Psychrobacter pygoscelis]|uniref:hypothetical protein n=1 Tax=Psychrobacter pygoscelis TaxID=2488563 RepID=UPI00103CDE6E|nr:hypothetical protein [Psychrobacter pygoscelis]